MGVSALARKLHLKPGQRILLKAPAFRKLLEPLPEGASIADKGKDFDAVLLFARGSRELQQRAPAVLKAMKPDALVWIAYPKKSAKVTTDLSRDCGWEPLARAGFEGVSLVAIDDVWSAMRFRPKQASGAKKAPARMSDDAVEAKTGKTWAEWFKLIDRASGRKMTHPEIVAFLAKEHDVGPWWQQMVTVAYEKERGLRGENERCDGFAVGRSKTVAAPAARAFAAWNDARLRSRWLADPHIVIHKATPNKSMRITWIDGRKCVDVGFYPKGSDRCQVAVQHSKLPDAKEAERMKAYWEENLLRFKEVVEG